MNITVINLKLLLLLHYNNSLLNKKWVPKWKGSRIWLINRFPWASKYDFGDVSYVGLFGGLSRTFLFLFSFKSRAVRLCVCCFNLLEYTCIFYLIWLISIGYHHSLEMAYSHWLYHHQCWLRLQNPKSAF